MRVAALDLGSNTFLLLIAEVEGGRVVEVLGDFTRVVRLGQDIQATGEFHPEALKRARACFVEFEKRIITSGAEKIVAVATSAARDARNKEEFLSLGREFQIPISIIDGETEARITFEGATDDFAQNHNYVVVDVGGGSTEIVGRGATQQDVRGLSVDLGSVRLTEMFLPKHPCGGPELKALEQYIYEQFERVRSRLPRGFDEIIAVAGTPTALAMLDQGIIYDEKMVHKFHIGVEGVLRWRDKLAQLSVAEREALPGMPPKRADVLVAGLSILAGACSVLGRKEITVSTRGVRFGVAKNWELFYRERQ